MAATERIFDTLARDCGHLRADLESGKNPLSNARAWNEQARKESRSKDSSFMLDGRVAAAARARAGLWASFRHWANLPGRANEKAFRQAVDRLVDPPGRYRLPSLRRFNL